MHWQDCIVADFSLRALFAPAIPCASRDRATLTVRCSFNHRPPFEFRFIGSQLVVRGHHHMAQSQNRNYTKIKKKQ
jgi:hypothetical protein